MPTGVLTSAHHCELPSYKSGFFVSGKLIRASSCMRAHVELGVCRASLVPWESRTVNSIDQMAMHAPEQALSISIKS